MPSKDNNTLAAADDTLWGLDLRSQNKSRANCAKGKATRKRRAANKRAKAARKKNRGR